MLVYLWQSFIGRFALFRGWMNVCCIAGTQLTTVTNIIMSLTLSWAAYYRLHNVGSTGLSDGRCPRHFHYKYPRHFPYGYSRVCSQHSQFASNLSVWYEHLTHYCNKSRAKGALSTTVVVQYIFETVSMQAGSTEKTTLLIPGWQQVDNNLLSIYQ